MNLGQSVAVCLYELIRNPAAAKAAPPAKRAARAADLDRLTELLGQALDQAGYVHRQPSTRLKLRRLIRRMNLNAHDAEVWLGMLRQILWKFSAASDTPRK